MTDILNFVLGKSAFYLDGILYYSSADRYSIPGTPNTYELDMKESEVVLSRWNTRTRYHDRRVPMNQQVVADNDVCVLDGVHALSPESRLRLTVNQYRTTLKAYQHSRRIKMGIIDNKIVQDNQGLRKPGVSFGDDWKKKPSILETEVGDMAVIQFFNEEHKSHVMGYNDFVWQRGRHVLFTSDKGRLPALGDM